MLFDVCYVDGDKIWMFVWFVNSLLWVTNIYNFTWTFLILFLCRIVRTEAWDTIDKMKPKILRSYILNLVSGDCWILDKSHFLSSSLVIHRTVVSFRSWGSGSGFRWQWAFLNIVEVISLYLRYYLFLRFWPTINFPMSASFNHEKAYESASPNYSKKLVQMIWNKWHKLSPPQNENSLNF